jgi:hypothetical protein
MNVRFVGQSGRLSSLPVRLRAEFRIRRPLQFTIMWVAVEGFLRSGGLPAPIAAAFPVAAAASPSRPAITVGLSTIWLVLARDAVARANALVGAGPAHIVNLFLADPACQCAGHFRCLTRSARPGRAHRAIPPTGVHDGIDEISVARTPDRMAA